MTTTLSSFVTADQVPRVTARLEEVLEIDKEIVELQRQIKSREQRRAMIIEEHINAGVTVEGPLSIQKKVTKRDTLDAEAFSEKYPDQFFELWREISQAKFKPSKSDALKVLTSFQVEKVCKHTETVSYTVEYDLYHGAEL